MRERRHVKFRVDMYDDTKLKIIDRRPNRDLVHYVWNRVMILAGKCNQEGELYMSRTIPYTVETLAIEFNRDSEEVKLALEILIELEMVEVTEDGVYRVKNFAKHQNIKVKEKKEIKNTTSNLSDKEKEIDLKAGEVQVTDVSNNESSIRELKNKDETEKQEQFKSEMNQDISKNVKTEEAANLEINQKVRNKVDNSLTEDKDNNSQNIMPIIFENKKNNKRSKGRKEEFIFEISDEDMKENHIDGFSDGEAPLGVDERIISEFVMLN